MTSLFDPLQFQRGAALKNRFMLAPMTNLQSNPDGVLGEDEYRWLVKRAEGGFGLTMTCAASAQFEGIGFPGQLGVYDDKHLPGLTRLAEALNANGTHSVVQLHHGGMRAIESVIGRKPQCPSDDAETGAVAMTRDEIRHTIDCFVAAAKRAERAGFQGVELHGAHGYLLGQFFSPQYNKRDDAYGGSPENRARILFEIVDGVRAVTGPNFTLGVRLSPERFGQKLDEIAALAQRLMDEAKLDYIDMSLWDAFKQPQDEEFQTKSLAAWFTELKRGKVKLGAAGKILTGAQAAQILDMGFDFAIIGRGAILHHDFPKRVAADPAFASARTPVSADYLRNEGLGEAFVNYMRTWKGFVTEEAA
jgi:2,4-dienoyl-CoA reductase-like NADH-dependent reductase (Old Yellow Enzyme family)